MEATSRTLTPIQKRFVDEYLIDLNATAAYRRAGYKAVGNAAETNASRLLRNAQVVAAIAEAQKARGERTQVTADRVLAELARLGFSNVNHFLIDDCGQVKLVDDAPKEAMQAVSSIRRKTKHTGGGRVEYDTEIRLWDKPGTLKTMAQHLGMLVARSEVSGPGGLPVPVEVTHNVHDDLAPFAAAIASFIGGGALPPPGSQEPVHPAQALPQAGVISPT